MNFKLELMLTMGRCLTAAETGTTLSEVKLI